MLRGVNAMKLFPWMDVMMLVWKCFLRKASIAASLPR